MNNKPKFIQRISVKTVIFNIIISFGLIALISLSFAGLRALGVRIVTHDTDFELFMILFGLVFAALFLIVTATVLDLTLTKRIYLLHGATAKILNGDYDITLIERGHDEITILSRSFNLMSQELKRNQYLAQNFIRDVSHEFKTPLSAIRAYAELIKGENISSQAQNFADILIQETDKLVALTKSILEISAIDSAMTIEKSDKIIVSDLVNEIIEVLAIEINKKNLKIKINKNSINILSNSTFLYQAIMNLVTNAIKFADVGSVVDINIVKNSQYSLVFHITNQGEIITPEQAERIFTLFYVSDSSRNKEGSGLGLAIAKRIANRLDGDISFTSEPTQGTKFTLRLK